MGKLLFKSIIDDIAHKYTIWIFFYHTDSFEDQYNDPLDFCTFFKKRTMQNLVQILLHVATKLVYFFKLTNQLDFNSLFFKDPQI